MGKYQGYEKYKESGVEWIGDIPEHWESYKLKRTVNIFGRIGFRGYTIEDIVLEGEGAVTLSPSNIFEGKITYEHRTYLSWTKYYESPEIQIFNKDILFVKTGSTIGKVAIVENMPEPMTINPQLVVLKEINCCSEFLTYLMNSDFYQFQVMGFRFGGSTPAMTQESLGKTQIVLPPLDEQESIACFLDRKTSQIDALIAKKSALLEKLDEKRTALISHAVTKGLDSSVPMKNSGVEWLGDIPEHWEVSRIGFVADIGNGSTPNRSNESFWDQGSIPWLNSSKVNEQIICSASQFVTEDAVKQCHLPIVMPDSIVLAITGEGKTRGNVAICKIQTTINQHLAYISLVTKRVSLHFLFLYLQAMYEKIRTDSAGNGSTKGAITCQDVKGYKFPLPAVEEQEKIVNFLNHKTAEIVRQKAKVKEAIELLKEYRTALITNAVTGKIDVRQVARV
jgi:type I restriction enzyme, S subunit